MQSTPDLSQSIDILPAPLESENFYSKVSGLKQKLSVQHRCTICTLKLPCTHYSSVQEMSQLKPVIQVTPHLSTMVKGLSKDPPLNLQIPKEKSLKIRYRSSNKVFFEVATPRKPSVPSYEKSMISEKIQGYREEKAKKLMEENQRLSLEECRIDRIRKQAEEKRRKHAVELKVLIGEYRDEYLKRMVVVKERLREEGIKGIEKERRRNRYLDRRKKILEEYRIKKELLDNIERKKVLELQEGFF